MVEGYEKATASTLKAYLEVTKLPSVALLVFTALGGMVVAAGGQAIPPSLLLQALLAATLGCAREPTPSPAISTGIWIQSWRGLRGAPYPPGG